MSIVECFLPLEDAGLRGVLIFLRLGHWSFVMFCEPKLIVDLG